MSNAKPPIKPEFKSTEPDSFDINISDQSGLRTLFLSLTGIVGILLAIYLITRVLLNFSPYFVSVDLENKIFKNTHRSLFKNSWPSQPLTDFAKRLDPENKDVVVYIIDMPQPNAFCFLGNKLFVTEQLLKTAESENELAFILSHELGHARLRHNLKNLSINLLMGLFFKFVDFLQPASQFLATGYSRSMETEADDFALKALENMYGHTHGAQSFFIRMQKGQSKFEQGYQNFIGEYLATHPNTSQRIKKIESTQNPDANINLILKEDSYVFWSLNLKTR